MKKSGPPRQNARGGKRTAANPRTATGPTGGASKKGAGSATQKGRLVLLTGYWLITAQCVADWTLAVYCVPSLYTFSN